MLLDHLGLRAHAAEQPVVGALLGHQCRPELAADGGALGLCKQVLQLWQDHQGRLERGGSFSKCSSKTPGGSPTPLCKTAV
jgi:hypothetical protein